MATLCCKLQKVEITETLAGISLLERKTADEFIGFMQKKYNSVSYVAECARAFCHVSSVTVQF